MARSLFGFVCALGLSIYFAVNSNIHAAFGWGAAAALWMGGIVNCRK